MYSGDVVLPEGWVLECLARTDSTNETAKHIELNDENRVSIVQADVQTAGRGRRGRAWIGREGNLFFSLALRVSEISRLGEYSFLTALALAEAIKEIAPDLRPECKWPNDVLIDGAKISGILLETDGKRGIERLIIGVGVNLMPLEGGEMLYPVTSLAQKGCFASKETVLSAFAKHFDYWDGIRRKNGFSPVLTAWKNIAYGLGGEITVNLPDRSLKGVFSGLDKDGCLLLNNSDGEYKITAGDVFFGKQEKQ